MEYTYLTLIFVIIIFILDMLLGTKLFCKKSFWIFWGVMAIMIFIINGYLTWRPIVTYNNFFNLNLRIFTIPVEDFFFGFSLLTFNLIIWEFTSKKWEKK